MADRQQGLAVQSTASSTPQRLALETLAPRARSPRARSAAAPQYGTRFGRLVHSRSSGASGASRSVAGASRSVPERRGACQMDGADGACPRARRAHLARLAQPTKAGGGALWHLYPAGCGSNA